MTANERRAINMNTLAQIVGLVAVVSTAVWAVGEIRGSVRVLSTEIRHLSDELKETRLKTDRNSERITRLEERSP